MKNSFNEHIFNSPKLYELKAAIITKLNRGFTDFARGRLAPLTQGKEVIDIGCGSRQFFYDPEKTRSRLGVDESPAMIENAKKLYPSSSYLVSRGEDLNLPEKSFDTVLLLFFLHHVSPELWERILYKVGNIARESVVILDHVKSDLLVPSLIQSLWWNTIDGGKAFRKEREWQSLLKDFKINEYQRKGSLFKNVCYYHLSP